MLLCDMGTCDRRRHVPPSTRSVNGSRSATADAASAAGRLSKWRFRWKLDYPFIYVRTRIHNRCELATMRACEIQHLNHGGGSIGECYGPAVALKNSISPSLHWNILSCFLRLAFLRTEEKRSLPRTIHRAMYRFLLHLSAPIISAATLAECHNANEP